MKPCLLWIAVALLVVHRAVGQEPGRPVRLVPTNNIAAARSKYPLSDHQRIAQNTPEFEQWGLSFMLNKANEVREKWNLDIRRPLTVNDVLFQLKATAYGIDGALEMRSGRYIFSFGRNALTMFLDTSFWPRSFRYKPEESLRLAKIRSRITAEEALAIAREKLHALGLDERMLRLREPPQVHQYTFEDDNGTVYPLPIFHLRWRAEDDQAEGDELPHEPVTFDISGVTKNVAKYFNVSSHAPREPLPSNYFRMLGLPDNYLDTLDERTRRRLGLPPKGKPEGVQ